MFRTGDSTGLVVVVVVIPDRAVVKDVIPSDLQHDQQPLEDFIRRV